MKVIIRKAFPEENEVLTEISFASKHLWNYPEDYFKVWKAELTITSEYIQKNILNIAEQDDKILGYYSLVKNDRDFWAGRVFVMKGYWLEHIFIRPEFIRKGIGTQLIRDVQKTCKELGIKRIYNIF
jgi:maltose O-acetyltransferase